MDVFLHSTGRYAVIPSPKHTVFKLWTSGRTFLCDAKIWGFKQEETHIPSLKDVLNEPPSVAIDEMADSVDGYRVGHFLCSLSLPAVGGLRDRISHVNLES